MGKHKRREFLEGLISTQLEDLQPSTEDTLFKKYANKEVFKAYKSTSTLNQYTGPWTETQVRHLLRRTMFGTREGDVQPLLNMTMSDAVDYLIDTVSPAPQPPVNNYTDSGADPTGVAAGATWVNADYGDGNINFQREVSLKAWWLGLMLNQDMTITEKMTFFWHNHFATQMSVVSDARMSYNHYVLLRSQALGNIKTLARQVTTDAAMLRFLNGEKNNKNNPDENYGRELQELFTVGKFNTPNYSEDDVKAAARVLTGWRINNSTLTGYFQPALHDTSNKIFSAFYSAHIIGNAGATETDDLIDMIFAKRETAHYICGKLYRFFIYYNIDDTIETDIIAPLTQICIDNNYDVKPVLKALLKSDHFYDPISMGCYIKTPLDFLVGTMRSLNVDIPAALSPADRYAICNFLRNFGSALGLDLGDPPSVAGWEAFYESPAYYEMWINSSTYPLRMEFTDMLLSSGFNAGTDATIKIDVTGITKLFANASDPDALVTYFTTMLCGIDVSSTEHDNLKSILLSNQANNQYWTDAWNIYALSPDAVNTDIVTERLTGLLVTILRLPECQLC
jgi:uncharacterized protein (DUF1800 family)